MQRNQIMALSYGGLSQGVPQPVETAAPRMSSAPALDVNDLIKRLLNGLVWVY